QAQGIDKAKHLHEAMQAVGEPLALAHYGDTIKQIIALDADNEAGLKQHYQDIFAASELRKEMTQILSGVRADAPGTIQKLDEFLAKEGMPSALRQEALANRAQVLMLMIKD